MHKLRNAKAHIQASIYALERSDLNNSFVNFGYCAISINKPSLLSKAYSGHSNSMIFLQAKWCCPSLEVQFFSTRRCVDTPNAPIL